MLKPRLFAGSSSEQIPLLNKIIDLIGEAAECIPWTNAFDSNKSGLDSLIKRARLADFSILLATKDDLLTEREETYSVPRDNVIFEFGLFLGSSSPFKCFLIAEDGANLPSDLEGITVFKFTREDDKYNSIEKIVENIVEQINKVSDVSELGLLPSTALAIGYFNCFLKKVCDEIINTSSITIESKKVKIKEFKIDVLLPAALDDDGVDSFIKMYNIKHNFSKASTFVESSSIKNARGYPFHFKVDPPEQNLDSEITVQLSDIPTTLSTIIESLKLFLPLGEVGLNEDRTYLEKRELANFSKVLKYLINRNSVTKNYVTVIENVTL
jgi:hypothetical protein